MFQDKYILLPDGMDPLDVQKCFDELLSEAETSVNLQVCDVLEALYELADRQWHSYTILPAEYKNRVEQWLKGHWLPSSVEFVVRVAFIAGCIGLPGVLQLFEADSHNPHLREDVRKNMVSILEELKPIIHDPYHGMPKG